jgi:hypothetical protein
MKDQVNVLLVLLVFIVHIILALAMLARYLIVKREITVQQHRNHLPLVMQEHFLQLQIFMNKQNVSLVLQVNTAREELNIPKVIARKAITAQVQVLFPLNTNALQERIVQKVQAIQHYVLQAP